MDGTELASYYAFPPNRHGYCGTRGFCAALRNFQGGKTGPVSLRTELERFSAHYAYLSLIARESGLGPFDKEVVRAFWTGNGLLESVRPGALRSFIEKDLLKGKQPARARRLCDGLPDGLLPHHSFNVLYVNFVSDSVPRTIRNYDSCCITSGKILSVSGKDATLLRRSIGYDGGFAIKEKKSRVLFERGGMRFVSELKTGDVVSVHWGMIIEKLGGKDERLLDEYTLKNMRAINDSAERKKMIR
jgi:hypothetical protein